MTAQTMNKSYIAPSPDFHPGKSDDPPVIQLPNNWTPKPGQMPALAYLQRGGKRAFWAWHRRYGKDDAALHWTACAAMQRVGTYWHMLPEAAQCRKAIWEAVNPRTGRRRIDEAFPDAICETKRGQDMFIRFINGSTWQLVGSDNYNSLVGSPPVGLVFSEYALANPTAWGFLRMILLENDGWALFVTTFRGKNHAWRLHKMAKAAMEESLLRDPSGVPDWYASLLTVDDTQSFDPEGLARERQELIDELGEDEGEAMFQQEYYCNPEGAVSGAYFGSGMRLMRTDGRISRCGYEPSIPVDVGFDIGVSDAMAIVFVQRVGTEIRIIDYYEASGESVQTAAKMLQAKPYTYGTFYMPHDIKVREWGNKAQSRYDTALSLGIKPISTVTRISSVADIAHVVRSALPRIIMDSKRCDQLIEHLQNYKKTYNQAMKMWEDRPAKGPARHGIDALVTYLRGYEPKKPVVTVESIMAKSYSGGGVW